MAYATVWWWKVVEDLRKNLKKYKELTENLILLLEKEDIESLEKYLDLRKEVINNINKLSVENNDFKVIINELNLLSLEETFNKKLKEAMDRTKKELLEVKKGKQANKGYNRSFLNTSILNKKI